MVSNYYGTKIDPLEAIALKPEYIDISDYAMQLKQYLKFFELDRFYVTTFEALTTHPGECYQDILKWLNVDSSFVPDSLHTPQNVSATKIRSKKGFGLLLKLRGSQVWGAIGDFFPRWLTGFGSRLALSHYEKSEISMEPLKQHLRTVLRPKVNELKDLLPIDLSAWKDFQ